MQTLSGKSRCVFQALTWRTNTLYSALAALENNDGVEDTRSPPSEQGSPQTSKATPSIDAAADSAAPPS